MSQGNLSIEISKDIVNPIINEKIKGAILTALGGQEKLIEEVVKSVLDKKVSESGQVSSYSSENKYRWVDQIIMKQLSEIVKESVKNWFLENRDAVSDEINRQLSTKGTRSAMVKSFISGIANKASSEYYIQVQLGPKGK